MIIIKKNSWKKIRMGAIKKFISTIIIINIFDLF